MDELSVGNVSVAVASDPQSSTVRLVGELDIAAVDAVRSLLERSLPSAPERVVFDLADLQFMDSSGIAMMLGVAQRAGDVELRDPSPVVRRIVEAVGLSEILRMVP